MLYSFQVYSTVTRHLITLWNDNHNKCSYPRDLVTIQNVYTIIAYSLCTVHYIPVTCFISGGVYLLIPFTYFAFFFKNFIYLFLEQGEGEGEREERNINVWLPLVRPPLGT